MDPDFLFIQRMKNGDDAAVETFVRKYYPKILQYCHLHISDPGHAEDVTQETFERFFRSFDRYRPYGRPANYLYAVAVNRCRDYYRRRKEELLPGDFPEPAVNSMEEQERRMDLEMAFRALPQEQKEAAGLFFFQEMKQKEIAKTLGIGLPLVKYRIRKARETLGKYFKDVEEGG